MFTSTHAFAFFDVMRVPYLVVPRADSARSAVGHIRRPSSSDGAGSGPELIWVRTRARSAGRRYRGRFGVAGFEVAGVVHDVRPERLDLQGERTWSVREAVRAPDGHQVGAVWTSSAGDVLLPFDPGAVMTALWSEAYTQLTVRAYVSRRARTLAVTGYYWLRPSLPRTVQLRLRRVFAHGGHLPDYPAWPVEHGLHDLYEWLLQLVAGLAGTPVPWLHPWPDGSAWAMVLTHDVETRQGYQDMELLRAPERERSYRSSWNFVPGRYDVDPHVVERVQADHCEVGVHGLHHDGKDLRSRRMLRRRLPAMREFARSWGAVGFRSPGTQRRWDLMPRLGFLYDSSYTDTEPYEPQPGGCCTYWPFFNEALVELPISLPQDHTLYEILGHRDAAVWVDKGRELRRRGGMLLVLSHPDYAHGSAVEAWKMLLEEFADDETKWQALPREVAEWWRLPGRLAAGAARRPLAGGRTGGGSGTCLPRPGGLMLDQAVRTWHVAIVVENVPLGVDTRLRKQVDDLLDAGHRVSVVTMRHEDNEAYRSRAGIQVLEYPPPREPAGPAGYAREYAVAFMWALVHLTRLRLRGHIDVLQVCQPPDIYFPLFWMLRLTGTRVVVDQRDLMPELLASRYDHAPAAVTKALHWLERRTYRSADVAVTVNGYLRDRLVAAGAHPDRTLVVRNGPVLRRVLPRRPGTPVATTNGSSCGPGRWAVRTGWTSSSASRSDSSSSTAARTCASCCSATVSASRRCASSSRTGDSPGGCPRRAGCRRRRSSATWRPRTWPSTPRCRRRSLRSR